MKHATRHSTARPTPIPTPSFTALALALALILTLSPSSALTTPALKGGVDTTRVLVRPGGKTPRNPLSVMNHRGCMRWVVVGYRGGGCPCGVTSQPGPVHELEELAV
jgi:hypothetical protein